MATAYARFIDMAKSTRQTEYQRQPFYPNPNAPLEEQVRKLNEVIRELSGRLIEIEELLGDINDKVNG